MRKQLTVGSLLPARPTMQAASPAPVTVKQQPQAPSTRFSPPVPQEKTEKKQVQVKQRDQAFSVSVAPCQTLLEAALAQGLPIAYKCQQGYCGKCSIQVTAGAQWLGAPTLPEQTKLGKQLASGYRLACQSTFPSSKRK